MPPLWPTEPEQMSRLLVLNFSGYPGKLYIVVLTHPIGQAAGVFLRPALGIAGAGCWRQGICDRAPASAVYLACGQEWPEKA